MYLIYKGTIKSIIIWYIYFRYYFSIKVTDLTDVIYFNKLIYLFMVDIFFYLLFIFKRNFKFYIIKLLGIKFLACIKYTIFFKDKHLSLMVIQKHPHQCLKFSDWFNNAYSIKIFKKSVFAFQIHRSIFSEYLCFYIAILELKYIVYDS